MEIKERNAREIIESFEGSIEGKIFIEKMKLEIINELAKPKKVYAEICRDNIELPEYARIGDAGMDVRAAERVVIKPGETKLIPTGLKMAIPDGYVLDVRPRSGLSLRTPLGIANAPGTIDCGFRGEINIIITNNSPVLTTQAYQETYDEDMFLTIDGKDKTDDRMGTYVIKAGDRIAQLVLIKFETIKFENTDDVSKFGSDRGGGFGHTGTN